MSQEIHGSIALLPEDGEKPDKWKQKTQNQGNIEIKLSGAIRGALTTPLKVCFRAT
ncbi:hypothetical protein [Anabaena azotica]|uniref:hypothetical protein n=1 Tax=Anabaena azotica TaxID=197653 RepID=UPI0039A50CA0